MTSIGLLVLLLALTTIDAQNECSDRNANCINIHKCPSIVEILNGPRPLSEETLQTLRNALCDFEGNDPMVCCTNQVTTTTPLTTTSEPEATPAPPNVSEHPNLRLLDHETCGPLGGSVATSTGHIDRQRIDGNRTRVFENPWMAIIAYDVGKANPEFYCGGTIISSRYILTAAQCVTLLPRGFTLVSVRVGAYDISKECDCDMDDKEREIQCAKRYQDFGVENFYYHPEYLPRNDIALIRLNGSVDFRPANVKPICLPIGTATTINVRKAIMTGWAKVDYKPLGQRNRDLLQVKLPLMSYEQCKEMYEQYKPKKLIWHKQLCAGGESNVDFCLTDGIGSLQAPGIYNDGSMRMVQHGVPSYGQRQCDRGYPGVFTRISYYMDWILNTMTD